MGNLLRVLFLFFFLGVFSSFGSSVKDFEQQSSERVSICKKFLNSGSHKEIPYNCRLIDGKFLAGGNLFNPETHQNSSEQILRQLKFLKEFGVSSVILLHVPLGKDKEIADLERFCQRERLKIYKFRMTSEKVPTPSETKEILSLLNNGAYVHCMWGCDRTGSIIAKYLRTKKGYTGEQAWRAVITGGSHSGSKGGFKQTPSYKNLVLYFWPEVPFENMEVCRIYDLSFNPSSR
ncbi:hypothetical protein HYY75_10945 [bacterium]|nr:hypothetical protein [bacterium]